MDSGTQIKLGLGSGRQPEKYCTLRQRLSDCQNKAEPKGNVKFGIFIDE